MADERLESHAKRSSTSKNGGQRGMAARHHTKMGPIIDQP
jgi:hypothetical protein